MSLIDVLITPGAAIGCVVGVGAAVALQFVFPNQDLIAAQALLVIFFSVAGLVLEHHWSDSPGKR